MRVLLTGGSGLVGRNFLDHPNINEFEIFSPSSKCVNLMDYNQTYDYILQCRPDIIVHAAGKVGGIQANIEDPVGFLVCNMEIGNNIVGAARRAKVKKLINLGSSCMYPRNYETDIPESAILTGELEPTNEGYALAKIVVQRLCQYITENDSGYNYKTIMPCNLYGRYDKFDEKNSHLISAIILKVHNARTSLAKNIEIWGSGEAKREFMFAADFANLLYNALKYFDSLPNVMNAGMETDTTINDYYKIVSEIMGYKGTFSHNISKPSGMLRKKVDTTLLDMWGWKPRTTLEEGIKKTYEYFLEKNYLKRSV